MKTFDEVYETLPGNGWLSRAEAELLWSVALYTTGDVLEVGCYEGRSTVLLASTGRMVHVVDPFEGFGDHDPDGSKTYKAFCANVESRKLRNIRLYRCKVEDKCLELPRVGFAYLDGDHTYYGTRLQIGKARLLGVKAIAIHDVNDGGDGADVKLAALELLGPWDKRVERLAVWRNVR